VRLAPLFLVHDHYLYFYLFYGELRTDVGEYMDGPTEENG